MKKVFLPLACLCMVLVLAAGCGKQGTEEAEEGTETSSPSSTAGGDSSVVEGVYDDLLETILANGLCYEIMDEKYATVAGYDEEVEEVVLPDTLVYEGKEYPVEAIGDEAFLYDTTLCHITLPESLKTIGKEAFCGCTSLESIVIPSNVTALGTGVFYDCDVLASCVIGEGIVSLPNEIFTNCYALESIEIPDTLVSIGTEAFWTCEALTELRLPESVSSIGERAFYGSGIRKLTIPSPAIVPSEEMLEGLYELEELYVHAQQKAGYEENLQYAEVKVEDIEKEANP